MAEVAVDSFPERAEEVDEVLVFFVYVKGARVEQLQAAKGFVVYRSYAIARRVCAEIRMAHAWGLYYAYVSTTLLKKVPLGVSSNFLLQPVRGWRALTEEDHLVFETEDRMTGGFLSDVDRARTPLDEKLFKL